MYHRFSRNYDVNGKVDAKTFEWQLMQLKKGWNVISLNKMINILDSDNELPPYSVVLTVDDGYKDFYEIAYPFLKKYNMPATFFPTINFVNGAWLWWDKITYILDKTPFESFAFEYSNERMRLNMKNAESKCISWQNLSDYCIKIKNEKKWELVVKLEKDLKVTPPNSPNDEYKPVSWNDLKELSQNNIEIGAHTLSHPILNKVNNDDLKEELLKPINIFKDKLDIDVTSLCYPNGKKEDINDNVKKILENSKYKCAVTTENAGKLEPYEISRIGISNNKVDFLWKLYGQELMVK